MEIAEWLIDSHNTFTKYPLPYDFTDVLLDKNVADFIIRKIDKFPPDRLIERISKYRKNDELFDFYVSTESHYDKKVIMRNLKVNVYDYVVNNNYKMLCKQLTHVDPKYIDIVFPAFYISILYNKLEFADLLLDHMDFKVNAAMTSFSNKGLYNINKDAARYLNDLVYKKGYDIGKEFIRFYIETTIECDKYEVFTYLIGKFPKEAFEVSERKVFNRYNVKYLLKLGELKKIDAESI